MSARLILASGSASRARILTNAGVEFRQAPADVDEDALKTKARSDGTAVEPAALILAEAKARKVGRRYPNDLVLGADQILDCNGRWYDKPADRETAEQNLLSLRNKTHHLVNGLVIIHRNEMIWSHTEIAELKIRMFSEEFLKSYIRTAGDDILTSVGGYLLERTGAQLFDDISGDYFTILGLPLLPLLTFLRRRNLIET